MFGWLFGDKRNDGPVYPVVDYLDQAHVPLDDADKLRDWCAARGIKVPSAECLPSEWFHFTARVLSGLAADGIKPARRGPGGSPPGRE